MTQTIEKNNHKFMMTKVYVGSHNPFIKNKDKVFDIVRDGKVIGRSREVGYINHRLDELKGLVGRDPRDLEYADTLSGFEELSKEQVNRLYEDGHSPKEIDVIYINEYDDCDSIKVPETNDESAVYLETYAVTFTLDGTTYKLIDAHWNV